MPRKLRDIALFVVLLGIPLLFLQTNLKHSEEINAADRVILRISAPIQAGVTALVSAVHRTWRRYVYLVGLQEDNEHLLAQNMKLKRQLREAQRRLVRLRRYEKLLAFRAARGVETVGARVIGRSASPFVRALRVRIDRGGAVLRSGLPVVTVEGVVGRIGRVYGTYSDVILAVDPKSAIDVVIQRTGGRGLLRGKDARNRYLCRLDYLLRREEVKVGDVVVTSGAAGLFPRDLPVGRIAKVKRRTYGLYQEVEVTPTVDLSALEEVLVILAPPPPPAPKEGASRRPARGVLP
ncbi:MAG: rod shape-determining protein MreC [Deltaproteobacteria bacterium]|nr:rod shape-determining protein MreC [Deltaproteobacteria bacterium]